MSMSNKNIRVNYMHMFYIGLKEPQSARLNDEVGQGAILIEDRTSKKLAPLFEKLTFRNKSHKSFPEKLLHFLLGEIVDALNQVHGMRPQRDTMINVGNPQPVKPCFQRI